MIPDALRRRATELGVQLEYEDVDQVLHVADADVVARVVEILDGDTDRVRPAIPPIHLHPERPIPVDDRIGTVTDAELIVKGAPVAVVVRNGVIEMPADLPLGCHQLSVDGRGTSGECIVVVAPAAMPGGASSRRTSSLFAPTYALWDDDRLLPSFALLTRLARQAASLGIDTIATLPLYASFLDEPFDPSPYSPISRLHWNEAYIDDDGLPDEPIPDAMSGAADGNSPGNSPGNAGGGNVDWRAVGMRRRRQLVRAAVDADDELVATLARFVAAHPDVGSYARFRTDRESAGDLVVERSHVLGQYLADQQLGALATDDSAAALSLDLPIGSHPDGWETWAHPNLFAANTSVGAPPDTFFTEGQNWGFAPQLPGAMRSTGYELWRQMIARAGRHASTLRLDHVMAVHRLWWVPGDQPADRGVYVTYPHDELLAVIAASAAAADLTIVGENLGTVPPEVDRALDAWKMVGMYEEQFHLDEHNDDGRPVLAEIPNRSVAGVRTHDMAPFAVAADEISDSYVSLIGADDGRPLLDAVLDRLAHSDADTVVADLDDLLDERRPHNLPGRVVPGIWQRRLDRPLSDTLADERVARRLRLLERTPR